MAVNFKKPEYPLSAMLRSRKKGSVVSDKVAGKRLFDNMTFKQKQMKKLATWILGGRKFQAYGKEQTWYVQEKARNRMS